MFPKKEKLHEMKERGEEYYKANHANTERLKESTIPIMQRKYKPETKMKKFCSCRWGSSLPGLRTLDPPIGLPST